MTNKNIVKFRLSDEDFKTLQNRLTKINDRLARKSYEPLTLSELVRGELGFFDGDDMTVQQLILLMRPRSHSSLWDVLKSAIIEEDGKSARKAR